MIEVQVRRPCSRRRPGDQPEYVNLWAARGNLAKYVCNFHCPECGGGGYKEEEIFHRPVVFWMPLEQAVQEAHAEAVKETK